MIFKLNDDGVKLTGSSFNEKLSPSLCRYNVAYMQQLTLVFLDLNQTKYCRILSVWMQRLWITFNACIWWLFGRRQYKWLTRWLHVIIGYGVWNRCTLLWRCIACSCTLLLMMMCFKVFVRLLSSVPMLS